MSNSTGKSDRTGYHLKALQEIRNSLRPFATENGLPTGLPVKDGALVCSQQLSSYASTLVPQEVYLITYFALSVVDFCN